MTETDARASLTAERYVGEHVDDQLRWYGDESAANKRWHYRLQLVTPVPAASVPRHRTGRGRSGRAGSSRERLVRHGSSGKDPAGKG